MGNKKKKWDEFIKRVNGIADEYPELEKYVDESAEDNHENFLFVAAGEGKVVRGMHYPDGAFDDENFPLVFQTAEDNVVIAAWPRTFIKTLMQTLLENFDNSKHEKGWELVLEGLLDDALNKIKNGEVSGF